MPERSHSTPASAAKTGLAANAPSMIENSPTKLFIRRAARETARRESENREAFHDRDDVLRDVRERLHREAAALQNPERERGQDDPQRIEAADECDRDRDEAVAGR